MAYFGRTPKRPGSVPGSQSGYQQERRAERARRIVGEVERGRPQRASRASRAAKAVRSGRAGRKAR